MARVMKEIPVSRFKAQCLAWVDEVTETHTPIVITKRGKPVVKLVPLDDAAPPSLLGSVSYAAEDDLLVPVEDSWEADES